MNETSQLDIMQELAIEGKEVVIEVFTEEILPMVNRIMEMQKKIGQEAIKELHRLEAEVNVK